MSDEKRSARLAVADTCHPAMSPAERRRRLEAIADRVLPALRGRLDDPATPMEWLDATEPLHEDGVAIRYGKVAAIIIVVVLVLLCLWRAR